MIKHDGVIKAAVAVIEKMRLVDFYYSLEAQQLARELIYLGYIFPDFEGYYSDNETNKEETP